MTEQVSIRINSDDHERMVALAGRLTTRSKQRVSLADTLTELLDEYPNKKARKK